MRYKRLNERGQALLIAIGLVAILLILVPALVAFVATENRQAVRARRRSHAFYVAEAGLERGFWKLAESSSYWTALDSSTIAGYNADQAYDDVVSAAGTAALGTYTVQLSSYSLAGGALTSAQRVIRAWGRDAARSEVRALELIVTKPKGVRAAIEAKGIRLVGTGRVHWGPLMSHSEMTFAGGAIVRWPRKYATSYIAPVPPFDNNPAEPNSDVDNPNPGTEFWAYFDLGIPPSIDLAYYKSLAKCSTCAVAAGFPGGGAYYAADANISNAKDLEPMVRYGEGRLRFTGCVATRGVVIAQGNLEHAGGPCNVGQAPPGRYPAVVSLPSTAWSEYTKIDTGAAGEYPGDLGGPGAPGMSPTYVFGAGFDDTTHTSLTITHDGLAYTSRNWVAVGGTIVVGAILAPNDPGSGAGGAKVYYQELLNLKQGASAEFRRGAWRELQSPWPLP